MNEIFFGIVLILDLYVICLKLNFRLDIAGYTILLIQLFVSASRIFFT